MPIFDCSCSRFNAKYSGVPSAYTHTDSVNTSEPIYVKYATFTLSKPTLPPHKNTIIKGIITALNKTGKKPQRMTRKGSFFKNLPTMYELRAAKSVASEPIKTS